MYDTFSIFLTILTLLSGLFWFSNFFKSIRSNDKNVLNIKNKFSNSSSLKKKWKEFFISVFPAVLLVFIIRSFLFEPFHIPSGSMMPTLLIGDFILVNKFSYGIKDPFFRKTIIKISSPKRGDVAVFKYPKNKNLNFIKRVIGIPGDRIRYDVLNKEVTIQPGCNEQKRCLSKFPIFYDQVISSNFIQNFVSTNHGNIVSNFYFLKKNEKNFNGIRLVKKKEHLGKITYDILILPFYTDKLYSFYKQKNQLIGEWIIPNGSYFVMGDNRDNSADSRYWGFVPEENFLGKAVMVWMSIEKIKHSYPTSLRFKRFGTFIQ